MNEPKQNVITAEEVATARAERKSLVEKFANKYGIEPNKMMATLKATAFKGEVTTEQMAALLIVADAHNLNPWLKEIYAFPSRQGIVPIVGVDGWARIINEHPQFDGMDFEQTDESCTCKMYRKDRSHPTVVTEYMAECKRGTDPWQTHPKRMLRHKAMIQCARLAFAFAGIYDPDEGERILAAEAIDVTPAKIAPVRLRTIIDGLLESTKAADGDALRSIWNGLKSEEQLFVWDHLRSWERSAIKKLLDAPKGLPAAEIDLDPWSVEALRASASLESLETTWTLVQHAFAERDQMPSPDVEIFYTDRKAELGA